METQIGAHRKNVAKSYQQEIEKRRERLVKFEVLKAEALKSVDELFQNTITEMLANKETESPTSGQPTQIHLPYRLTEHYAEEPYGIIRFPAIGTEPSFKDPINAIWHRVESERVYFGFSFLSGSI